MDPKLLRLFLALEFLLALIAGFTLWSQVGGQGHLDLIPWYVKLGLGVGAAYGAVKATAASLFAERAWNRRALRWFSILLSLALAAGLITYYYHLYEEPAGEEENVTAALCPPPAPRAGPFPAPLPSSTAPEFP